MDEVLKLKKMLYEKADEIHRKKGHDYASEEDSLKNFKLVEFLGVCPAEVGCFIRLTDKISRIAQFLQTGVFKVESENLEDTIVDAINYLTLFYALINEKRRKQNV
jgi:hypothetical protein